MTTQEKRSVVLPFLPDDMIVQVLLRIPVRWLVGLKMVCKSWKSLISSPQFARDHVRLSALEDREPVMAYASQLSGCKRIGILPIKPLFDNYPLSVDTRVDSSEMEFDAYLGGSCNGLLCVHDGGSRFRLWNPFTRLGSEWVQIPDANGDVRMRYAGLGYDHVHDKYKVIVTFGMLDKNMLYTFGGNGGWKEIQFPIGRHRVGGIFIDGTLNWMAWFVNPDPNMILSFDLAKETFRLIPLPQRLMMSEDESEQNKHIRISRWQKLRGWRPLLGVMRSHLGVFVDLKKTGYWALWVMKEFGVEQSWTKLLMIPYVEPHVHSIWIPSCFQPLYMSENGNHVLARSPETSKLVLYYSHDHRVAFPLIDSSSDGHSTPLADYTKLKDFCVFHPSLVSPSHCGLPSIAF